MNAPVLAYTLLRWAAPDEWLETVAGDLEEEMESRGRGWYWKQAVKSLAPLAAARLRKSNWQIALLAILVCSAVQLTVIDLAWSWILSQVPLKVDITRGNGYVAGSLSITVLSASLAGGLVTKRGLALALPTGLLFTLLGIAAMRGITPAWFSAASTLAMWFALIAGCLAWRRVL